MYDDIISNRSHSRSIHMLQWLDAHSSGPTAYDETPAGGEDDQGSADRLYQLCLRALQDCHHQERDQRRSSSRSIALRECLGRFYLWGEPFGAGELDITLRQSDELRDNVLERLVQIGKLLLRSKPFSRQTDPDSTFSLALVSSIPPTQAVHQPSKQIKELEAVIKHGNFTGYGEKDELPQSAHASDEDYDSEVEGLSNGRGYDAIEDISFATSCLMELGPSLLQNLQHAGKTRDHQSNLTSIPFSVSGPAQSYVSSIREKFKGADYKLVERLGEANWQRHRNIRQNIENTEQSPEEITKVAGERGIACSIFRPYSEFHDSGIGTSVPAQSEYAPSHTSFQSSNPEGEQKSLRVPREPPEVAAGKPFQCCLCKCIISNVKNRVDWK